jgi:hypothetical protein
MPTIALSGMGVTAMSEQMKRSKKSGPQSRRPVEDYRCEGA